MQIFASGYHNSPIGSILACEVDDTGSVISITPISGVENPSFLALDQNLLFAINSSPSGNEITVFDISGEIPVLRHSVPGAGFGACHISVNPVCQILSVACYHSGDVTMFSYDGNGIGKQLFTKQYTVTGQESHPHCITASPDGAFLYLIDLGLDRIFRYRCQPGMVTEDGAMQLLDHDGPRQLRFFGTRGFLITEYSNLLYCFDYADGELLPRGCASTLPQDFSGESYGASVARNPVTGHIYASNRGANSIAVFSVSENGTLKLVGQSDCGGIWPRHIEVTSNGKFLLVANERSSLLSVLPIHPTTGLPLPPVSQLNVKGASFAIERRNP